MDQYRPVSTKCHRDLRQPGKELSPWNTKIAERFGVEFRAEAFNVFNNVNFNLYSTNGNTAVDKYQADPTFGEIFSAASPRILQLALKVTF
jgi:hypothetical protein